MLTKYIHTHSAPGNSRAIISSEKYNQMKEKLDDNGHFHKDRTLTCAHPNSSTAPKKGMHAAFFISSILV